MMSNLFTYYRTHLGEIYEWHYAMMLDINRETHLDAKVVQYLNQAMSEATKVAYQKALKRFINAGYSIPATPEHVAEYLSHAETKTGSPPSPSTINTWLSALGFAHKALGLNNPCESLLVRQTLKGIKRVHGTAQRQARPLLKKEVMSILPTDETGKKRVKAVRDTALILIGFSGMFRCSELVKLQIADLTETDKGMVILLRQSKTDQDRMGRQIGIPRASHENEVCPVQALKAWLAVLQQHGITEGALFRNVDRKNGKGGVIGASLTSRSVSRLLKKHAEQAGIDPTLVSGHSLRAGAATELALRGVDLWKIQQQGGWKDIRMLVERYIRGARLFEDNAMNQVW